MTEYPEVRATTLRNVRRIVIKLGSSLVTTTGEGLNAPLMASLVQQISELMDQGLEILLVSSGAVAAGTQKLQLKEIPRTVSLKQAAAAVGQSYLIWAYEKLFDQYHHQVAQVLLTHADLGNRRRYLNARNTLITLLQHRVIPIINENDTVSVSEIKFGDNDTLSALVTNLVEADLLIILTDTDGLYTQDPRIHPQAELITLVPSITPDIERLGGGKGTAMGTGGMYTKIQAAKKVVISGIPVLIANGRCEKVLHRLLAGEDLGTLFLPYKTPLLRGRKHWIVHTLKPRGIITVDDGAREAILYKGKSLLPSGIVAVEGNFEFGDAVTCCDLNGKAFARGLVNYNAKEVRRIKQHHTSHIESLLGYKYQDEVIHRDNLVLL
ncbi:MAG: glutamate 5-kinase [Nitrospinota bacterium]|nr:MAG: glutamate 5-kinase [Nitrospinota bacterium]